MNKRYDTLLLGTLMAATALFVGVCLGYLWGKGEMMDRAVRCGVGHYIEHNGGRVGFEFVKESQR